MKRAQHWVILVSVSVCAAHTTHAQQQDRAMVTIPPTTGTAMAVAPPTQNGESAVWITTNGAVFYCVRRPAPEPDKSPAGTLGCTGGRLRVPQD